MDVALIVTSQREQAQLAELAEDESQDASDGTKLLDAKLRSHYRHSHDHGKPIARSNAKDIVHGL